MRLTRPRALQSDLPAPRPRPAVLNKLIALTFHKLFASNRCLAVACGEQLSSRLAHTHTSWFYGLLRVVGRIGYTRDWVGDSMLHRLVQAMRRLKTDERGAI